MVGPLLAPEKYLKTGEIFWRDHQKWLQDSGYMMRPRYMPDWTPPWKGTNKPSFKFEESIMLLVCNVALSYMVLLSYSLILNKRNQLMDAIRISDGKAVGLKKVSKSRHPYEEEIIRFFSSDPLAKDPRNHCVPAFEILSVPDDRDLIIIVMPLLREYDSPRFDTYGEAVECIRQLLEVGSRRFPTCSFIYSNFQGLQFMHHHHVAHRYAHF
jgi:hypothetical protein